MKMNNLGEKAYIFGSIFTLSNKLQSLGDKLDNNLTVKQWLLLAGIFKCENDAPTITEVSSLIGNSRQNIKKMVLILEKEGFVTLQKDLNDARILRIGLTEKCLHYLKRREKKELQFLEQLFEGFDPNSVRSLSDGISKLDQNIIEMEKQYAYEKKE
ncbi:MAG: MarR family transcriptional regulator [Oscillospiraceae bacterium]|jgi:DNA-binding MarR family transcriptional regulator|nr:MarR family transcriptional regulator [Oscillospiraceae bacterium]